MYFFSGDGCAFVNEGDQAFDKDIEFVPMTWFETPSVVHNTGGNTRRLINRSIDR